MNILNEKTKKTIAFLGDSITADIRFNYISMLNNMLSKKTRIENINILNSGIDSSNIFDAIDRIPELFSENAKINLIFIFIGVNDSKRFHGLEKPLVPINVYREKYKDLLNLIKIKDSETQIILINLPYLVFDKIKDSELMKNYWYWDINEYELYNKSILELAKIDNLRVVDIFNSFRNNLPNLSSFYTNDGVHPNAKGHQLIAENIFQLF